MSANFDGEGMGFPTLIVPESAVLNLNFNGGGFPNFCSCVQKKPKAQFWLGGGGSTFVHEYKEAQIAFSMGM